jgi:hypothetical protein
MRFCAEEETMLNDKELIEALSELGIDADNYRVLSLLPFVLVAWSDGKIQRAERARIVEIARVKGFLEGNGDTILADWLNNQPLPHYYNKGFKVLIELARRERGMGAEMNANTLEELVSLSADIAQAAGGIFGLAWSVNDYERTALNDLGEILHIDDGSSWAEMLEDLEKTSTASE